MRPLEHRVELDQKGHVVAVLAFLVLLFLGAMAFGDEPPKPQVDASEIGRWGDRVTITGEGPRDGGEQLVSAAFSSPEDDSGRWSITVWGHSKDAASLALVKAFELDARLSPFVAEPPASLKRRPWAHFNFYQADDRTQAWRFADAQIPLTGPFPIVTVQVPRNGSFSGIASIVNKQGKSEARALIIDRIEAAATMDPAALGKRIRSGVELYCTKLAKSGFQPPAQLVAQLLEPRGTHQCDDSGSHGQGFPWGPQTPPPVPSFNPQWPPGGPAADVGATVEQLQAALPGAPADFILAQVKQRATVEAAQIAWRILQSQLTPPALPPSPAAPANRVVTILALLAGGLGITNMVTLGFTVWGFYRAIAKAQGRSLAIDDATFAALRDGLAKDFTKK
jgi:hypothetical protein